MTTAFRTPHTTEWHRKIAEDNLILLSQVGSGLHGVATDGDDRDEMGICIEPPECVIGLKRFEQYEFRTQPVGHRSGAGDLDKTIYSLRKYATLAATGNPTVLMILFAPESELVTTHWPGRDLRERRDMFLSKEAGSRFMGYLNRQRARMLGELSQRTNRPELVEKHGYDTKFAYHALRLAIQGSELMEYGIITLPMKENDRQYLLNVRNGLIAKKDVLEGLAEINHELICATTHSHLPDHPDYDKINEWLVQTHLDWWSR